jgi:dienelactone hydrolase
MGIVLYAPMLGETHDNHRAGTVRRITKQQGDEFRFLRFDWDQTVNQWADVVRRAYAECDPRKTRIVGMSVGSVATLVAVAAMEVQPRSICLLSLSARWKEDFPNVPEEHLEPFSRVQRAAFARLSFNDLAPRVRCPTLLLIGSREYRQLPTLAVRVTRAAELIPDSTLVIAEGAGHGLHYRGYQKALKKALRIRL